MLRLTQMGSGTACRGGSARTQAVLVLAALFALLGCSSSTEPGEGDFESAGYAGSSGADTDAAAGAPSEDSNDGGEREVEEADLYRFVGDRLYVLNQFRGLFVFDVSNPDEPVEVGRMPIHGYPVEMYVREDRAYAIVSNYFDYHVEDAGFDDPLQPVFGSRIVGIDLSDPDQPVEIGDVVLNGYITDSRLVGDVIYAAANRYAWWGGWGVPESETRDMIALTSINIADPTSMSVVDREEMDGNGWFVHATSSAFYVAGNVYNDQQWDNGRTAVQYVDISSPEGDMVARATISVDGYLQDDSAIDATDDQFRILTRSWNDQTSKLRIFDVSNPDQIAQLGQLDYFYEGGLFGTTFDGDRLYMIHYEVIDPLEVVDLSDPTSPEVVGILEMPGWVDRIAALGDRLIGLGVDDTDGRRVSLSLFDVSDPAAPQLLDRVSTGEQWSWSAATWERKAWTVDEAEGVILFPFEGYSDDYRRYRSALGIVEFDASTLTPRGEVESAAPVERGAIFEGRVYAISQAALQVVDIRDREAPTPTATLELARSITGYARTGGVGVEIVQPGLYYWWGNGQAMLRTTPLDAPDGREEFARIELPRPAEGVMTHGTLAFVVSTADYCNVWDENVGGCAEQTTPGISVVSVANASQPNVVADFDLPASGYQESTSSEEGGYVYSHSYWRSRYGMPFGGWQGGTPMLELGDGRFAILRTTSTSCQGLLTCRAVGIEPEDRDGGATDVDSEPPSTGDVADGGVGAPESDAYKYYGSSYTNELYVLDLRNPASPTLSEPIDIGAGNVEHLFVADGHLVYAHAEPSRVDESGRSWVRYYMKRFALTDDGLAARPAVNVPGVVVDLRGTRIVTLDRQWSTTPNQYGGYELETHLNALSLDGNRAVRRDRINLGQQDGSVAVHGNYAYLIANRSYGYHGVDGAVDAGGATSVSPGVAVEGLTDEDYAKLTTVDLSDIRNLRETSTQKLGANYWNMAALSDDVLVLSGGYQGLALFDLSNADAPRYDRYVMTSGWNVSILEDEDTLYLSGGPYGIQEVSLR